MTSVNSDRHEELWVLFIDDDPRQLIMLKPLIENYDPLLHVETLSDPIRAVERLRHFDYDCVVSEYIVGGKHGMNIFKAVKNIKPVPTILYTKRNYDDVRRMAEMSDVNGYILKIDDPNEYPTLIHFIRETVKNYRQGTPNRRYRNDPMKTWQVKKNRYFGMQRDVEHGA